jgi:ParB family transcriptional regulator, chromosome partitioning protein
MQTCTVDVGLISTLGRLRSTDAAQVKALAESIKEVGLLNPITVYRREIIRDGQPVEGYGLVAGAHRLEACKILGWQEVPTVAVDLSDDARVIAECDENLCASSLTKSERALFTRRRKEAYEALHPETKQGATGGTNAGKARSEVANFATSVPRFTADTAAKTGQSERAVQLDAERGEKIAPAALEKIKGTRLDTGVYLDKLKKVAPEKQVETVERDLATPPGKSETVSHIEPQAPEPEPEDPATAKLRRDLAKLTHAALVDDLLAERAGHARTKDKLRAARDQNATLKAQVSALTDASDMGRKLGMAIRERDTAKGRMAEYQTIAAKAERQVRMLTKERDDLRAQVEGQEIALG